VCSLGEFLQAIDLFEAPLAGTRSMLQFSYDVRTLYCRNTPCDFQKQHQAAEHQEKTPPISASVSPASGRTLSNQKKDAPIARDRRLPRSPRSPNITRVWIT